MRIQQKIQIAASAEKVWDIIWTNFGNVCDWASTVNDSSSKNVSGNSNGGRTCHSTWGEISEIVEDVNQNNMSYTYYADGLPKMMKSVKNTFTVNRIGENTSELEVDINIEIATVPKILMGWMIIPKMKKDIGQTLIDLKHFAETGKKTQAKIKSDEKYFKKNPKKVA